MSIRIINLWRWWGDTKDFSLINIDLHDAMVGGVRVVVCNVGFVIMWGKR